MAPLQYSLDKAKEEGMLLGRKKYLQQARQERERQVIANMFRKNMDIPLISEVTGLSEAEIKKLQKQHSKKQ